MFAAGLNKFWQRLSKSLYQTDANTIEQVNGVHPQSLRIYNRRDDPNNYERGFARWNANVLEIGTEKAGSGADRSLRVKTASGKLEFDDGNGWIARTSFSNALVFCPSFNSPSMGLTASLLNTPAGVALAIAGGAQQNTYISPYARTNNPGVGHNLAVSGGDGYYIGTGDAGGVLTLSGGAAGGSGNNAGGNVAIRGGVATGTGTKGIVTASRLRADGFATAFAAKTADYTSTPDDGTLTFDASGAARTCTLETAVGAAGRIKVIVKIDSSANTVTIDPNASETINGAATLVLSAQWDKAILQSDGSNWIRIA